MKRAYFDHAATAPIDPEVAEAMSRVLRDPPGNPSSVHVEGRRARAIIDRARDEVAAAIGADPSEIVFTSGGTEADNLALRGALVPGAPGLITVPTEHHAILDTAQALATQGVLVRFVAVDRAGRVAPSAVGSLLDEAPARLVSVMHANNEIGTVQPIARIAAAAHERGTLFHTDAVQSAGALPFDAHALGVDLASVSGHKLGGPPGTGALFVRRGTSLVPAQTGGGQERGLRPGTESIAGIVGFGVAMRLAASRREACARSLQVLRDRLIDGVRTAVPGAALTGDPHERLPGHASFTIEGVRGDALVMALDLEGFAVSSGSACTAGRVEPSHVLLGAGFDRAAASSSLRVTLGPASRVGEIDALLAVLPRVVARIRAAGQFGAVAV